MSDDRTFADEPVSISELRAHKNAAAKDWTPRDALIDTLRSLDRGEIKPTALVVCYQQRLENGAVGVFTAVSVPDRHVALGVLSAAAHQLQNGISD